MEYNEIWKKIKPTKQRVSNNLDFYLVSSDVTHSPWLLTVSLLSVVLQEITAASESSHLYKVHILLANLTYSFPEFR